MFGLAWGLFSGALLFLILLSWLIVRYFTDPTDNDKCASFSVFFTLFVLLLSVAVLPVDVYVVSSNINAEGMQIDPSWTSNDANVVRYIYFSMYLLIALLAFVILPFVFFLYEEDDDDATFGEKACTSLKYTSVFVIVLVVLILVGIFLKGGSSNENWITLLQQSYGAADKLASFFVGCLSTIGMLAVIFYTGYGLVFVPAALIRSGFNPKPVETPSSSSFVTLGARPINMNISSDIEVDSKIKRNSEHIRFLTSRYALSNTEMSQADRLKLHELQREERRLKSLKEQETDSLKGNGSSPTYSTCGTCYACLNATWSAFGWLRAITGFCLAAVSILIIVSLGITLLDKALNSTCALSCGYQLTSTNYLNPLNSLLIQASQFFPIDYIIFGLLGMYMVICSISALCSLGVKLVCVTYRVEKNRTLTNSLLMLSFVLIFIILALNIQFLNMAPQYTSFGTQFYLSPVINSTEIVKTACTPQATINFVNNSTVLYTNLCIMTQLSHFTTGMTSSMPVFGLIFYYGSWGLVGSFFLNILFTLACPSYSAVSSGHRLLDNRDEEDY